MLMRQARLHPSARAVALGITLLGLVAGASAQDTFSSISSVYFEMKYQGGVQETDVRNVLDYVQSERATIIHQVGFDSTKKIEVRLYNSVGRFLTGAGVKQPWRGAYYFKNVLHVQPVQALEQRGILESAISYELAMGYLEAARHKGCPQWLQDAYAVYFSGEMKRLSQPVGVRLSAFSDLNQDIQQYPNPPQRDDVHFVLGQTMKFFIDKYGETKVYRLFREFDGMSSVETVFKRVFGEEYHAIERVWAGSVKSSQKVPH
jgi:hypothetical protein